MTTKKSGLGRGLSAIFSETEEDYGKNLLWNEGGAEEAVTEVPIQSVYANPDQPRKVFDQSALEDLAASIRQHGIIMPIIVNKEDNGYRIIAGERRFRAARIAGLGEVPVIVKNYDEKQIKEISLIENLQREDLNPIESATAMKALMDDYGLTQEELSERIGKSRPAIANTLRLLTLEQDVIKLIVTGKLSAGHARALIPLAPAEQVRFAKDAVGSELSVRELENKVKDFLNPPAPKPPKEKPVISAELKDLVSRMQRVFGTKVAAVGNDNKGRVYIDYYMREDLDRISELVNVLENQNKNGSH